jgi:hypothetical protein
MSKDTLKLSDREVLQYARETLEQHLSLEADGSTCTTEDLFNVLLGVAAGGSTVESVCADLMGIADAETIRGYLNEQLCVEDLPALQRRLNAALADEIPRRIWRQPRVVARVYNPRQVEVYQRLGLVTISSTTWGAERIHELLTHSDLDAVMSFGSGEVSLVAVEAPPRLVGRVVRDITVAGEISVVAIVREGKALLPAPGTEFRARDVIHLAVLASAMERVEALLGA